MLPLQAAWRRIRRPLIAMRSTLQRGRTPLTPCSVCGQSRSWGSEAPDPPSAQLPQGQAIEHEARGAWDAGSLLARVAAAPAMISFLKFARAPRARSRSLSTRLVTGCGRDAGILRSYCKQYNYNYIYDNNAH